jgi:peptide/nickel transport system permease protein
MRGLLLPVARTVLTLWGVLTLTFVLGRLQGDPVRLLLPLTAPSQDFENMRAALGLDQPIPVQYVTYIRNILSGQLGNSIASGRPVLNTIVERIPATLELGIPAFLLSVLLAIPLGILAALTRNRATDRIIMTFSLIGHSLPAFIIGILLILMFSVNLQWLPAFGRDNPANLVLPAITLAVYPLSILVRLTRSSVLEVLNESYIRTAYAKGLSSYRVIFVHTLRNALIPVVTVVGLQIASIISGAAIIETVFSWPGIGWLAVQAIGSRDYPIIQGIVLLSAFAFSLTNLAVDAFYVIIDPRIRD